MPNDYQKNQTICWDCANATGGCAWSARREPVAGWNAEPRRFKMDHKTDSCSYIVRACPMFERDSYEYGMKREDTNLKVVKSQ